MHSRSKMIATACGLALCLGMLPATAVVSLADDEGAEVAEAAQAPEVAEGVVDEGDDADIEAYAAAADDKLNITGTFMYKYAKEQLDLMNQERKDAGVGQLVMSKSLQQAAMQRAAEIAVYNSHTRPNGQVYSTLLPKDAGNYIGENSSVGYNTPSEVTEGWMKCDAREKFILNAKFKSVGIGCVQIGDVCWWVQCYGTVTTDQGYVATENRTETKVVEVSYSTVNHDTYEIRAQESDTNVVKIAMGSSSQLQVGILADSDYDFYTPFTATDYTWSSSNSSVASVDSNGLVKGVSGGTATITAKSKYNGRTVTKAVSVSATSLAKAKVAVSAQTFTGSALTPAPTVTLDGKTLTAGKDYTVAYSNNVYPGTAKVTVTGKGNYSGTVEATFKINAAAGTVVMIRLYNPWSGEHLYTSSNDEISKCVELGWKNEGLAWIAPKKSNTPVYRLYNPYSGDHHYTTSKDEYNACAKQGWKQEGIGWYSDDAKGKPLYRGYNPYVTVGTHHYTTNWDEMATMKKNGWKYEGTAWYGLK